MEEWFNFFQTILGSGIGAYGAYLAAKINTDRQMKFSQQSLQQQIDSEKETALNTQINAGKLNASSQVFINALTVRYYNVESIDLIKQWRKIASQFLDGDDNKDELTKVQHKINAKIEEYHEQKGLLQQAVLLSMSNYLNDNQHDKHDTSFCQEIVNILEEFDHYDRYFSHLIEFNFNKGTNSLLTELADQYIHNIEQINNKIKNIINEIPKIQSNIKNEQLNKSDN